MSYYEEAKFDKVRVFFERNANEYLKHDSGYAHLQGVNPQMFIFNKFSEYGMHSIISGANHDVIYLGGDPDTMFEKYGPQIMLDMLRCGLLFNDEFACFYMNV